MIILPRLFPSIWWIKLYTIVDLILTVPVGTSIWCKPINEPLLLSLYFLFLLLCLCKIRIIKRFLEMEIQICGTFTTFPHATHLTLHIHKPLTYSIFLRHVISKSKNNTKDLRFIHGFRRKWCPQRYIENEIQNLVQFILQYIWKQSQEYNHMGQWGYLMNHPF